MNKRATKSLRVWVPVIAVCCALSLLARSSAFKRVFVFLYSCPSAVRAISWQHQHGNTISADGHLFHLPAHWYPEPESRPGKLVLEEAHFGSNGLSSIEVLTRPRKMDERAAQKFISEDAALFNQRSQSSNDWSLEDLRGRKLSFHCMMSSTQGALETVVCQAVDSNLEVVMHAAGRRDRAEALNILETSE